MKKLLSSLLMLFVALTMNAQMYPEKLPVDSAVRVGHLENGLTYYIRHNEQPKQRCEFHIAQCVGAILEEDNQNGLAHFLEHMAFNGTQHFPGKGIIDYFESIGVNFGGNINAYTTDKMAKLKILEIASATGYTVADWVINSYAKNKSTLRGSASRPSANSVNPVQPVKITTPGVSDKYTF